MDAFAWNRSYDDHEQVRPYMAGYHAVRDELDAAGRYPYNDCFVGRIEGLADSSDEKTGIYLLQTLHQLDLDAEVVAAFVDEGGESVTADDLAGSAVRGSVLHHGYYMGGTGVKRYDDVRLMVSNHRIVALPKGARTRGYALSGGEVKILRANPMQTSH